MTVIVTIFLVYPYMVKEIALMLNCSDETCVSLGSCHSFLIADPSIDCSQSSYGSFRSLALAFSFIYGIGFPLLGYFLLSGKRKKLKLKQVLGRFGFLYAGYRETKYYWEMVNFARKAIMVLIVVALHNYPRYQLYAATWTMTFFVFLNMFVKPFKYALLWKMESLSLVSIMVTLNLGLLFFESLTSTADLILSVLVFTVNVVVCLLFIFFIIEEAKSEVYLRMDANGDGEMTCDEVTTFFAESWKAAKPDLLVWSSKKNFFFILFSPHSEILQKPSVFQRDIHSHFRLVSTPGTAGCTKGTLFTRGFCISTFILPFSIFSLQRSKREKVENEMQIVRQRRWNKVDTEQRRHLEKRVMQGRMNTTAEFGYWSEYYKDTSHRQNRFEWIAASRNNPKQRSRQDKGLTAAEMPTLWEHGLGAFSSAGPPA